MIEKVREKFERVVPMEDALWVEMQEHAKKVTLKKGEVLVPYSSNRRTVNVIVSGTFEASLISSDGDRKTVWFFFDELFDVAICMDSYYLNENTKYEITALEDSVVYQFSKKIIDKWINDFTIFNEFYRTDIVGDFILLNEIRNHMVAHTPKEFLQYLKKHFPILLNRTPSKNLATFMGITPEWLSKIRNGI
ncbi:MAG: hypothetical protein AAFZ89_08560 [Bacteroidota bacterium]